MKSRDQPWVVVFIRASDLVDLFLVFVGRVFERVLKEKPAVVVLILAPGLSLPSKTETRETCQVYGCAITTQIIAWNHG